MKKILLFGVLALGLNIGMQAQEIDSYHTDYTALALQDALHDQTLITLNQEDEEDYFKDQKKFEIALRDHNSIGYYEYITAKQNAYKLHKNRCNNHCEHSPLYYNLVAYYDSPRIFDSSNHPQNRVNQGEIYR